MLELPVPEKDQAHVTFQVTLEGASYGLEWRWNVRDDRWYLSLSDAEGQPIATGRPVVLGDDWLDELPPGDRPPGAIVAVVSEDYLDGLGYDLRDPGFEDLASRRVRVLYASAAEVEVARAG